MSVLTLRGRRVVGGIAEGEALVTKHTISGFGGTDPMTGTIIERRHELVGQSFKGRVLVFPGAKGSSGWASNFQTARLAGAAPAAMLFNITTTKIALGAVVLRVPAMTDFDMDPILAIRTGDWVRVDADAGVVEVLRRAEAAAAPSARTEDDSASNAGIPDTRVGTMGDLSPVAASSGSTRDDVRVRSETGR